MSLITIEHNPSEERLKELGVAGWPTWEKEISNFQIAFDETETAYILEGEIIVTPVDGEPVRILAGDLVVFPEGLNSLWEVVKPLRKHYYVPSLSKSLKFHIRSFLFRNIPLKSMAIFRFLK